MSFVYNLDEPTQKLLSPDNFLGGMSVHDFIEELSKDHSLKGAEVHNLEYLDPKPYIRTFESTLRQLKQLSENAESKKRQAESDVDAFELRHSEQVLNLLGQVEQIAAQFDHLDTDILGISARIDPLNQKLNRISASRDRSQETIFLIRAYHGFYTKGKYEPLDRLRTSHDYELRHKCAKTTGNLLVLARKIDAMTGLQISRVSKCVVAIEKYLELMEQAMIDRFEMATDESDFSEMRAIAQVLLDFNGGSLVVLAFMNKLELFVEGEIEGYLILDDEAIWTKLADPNFQAHGLFHEEATETLLHQLRAGIKGQLRVVQAVFELPVPVLKILVQRVFAQMLQNKVQTLLLYAQPHGPLVNVRLLHAVYVLVGDFVKDVKEFFSTNDYDDSHELAATLDQCYYDLFMDHLHDDAYFRREKEMLELEIFATARLYARVHEKALAGRALESRLAERDLDITQPGPEKHVLHFMKRRRLAKFADFVRAIPEKTEKADKAEQLEYAQLSPTKVQTVIKLAIEAVARILELAPQKTPEHALDVLEILLLDFGGLYIGRGLEVAYDQALQQLQAALTGEVQLGFLSVFNISAEILFLLLLCIKRIILPCAVNNPNIKNRMVLLTNNYVARCELALNLLVQATVDIVTERLALLLHKQKKKDFVTDSINTNQDYTDVCELISDFLLGLHSQLAAHLNNANLNNVLLKCGMIALNLLLDHFKKFTVNSTGGIVLTQDVIRYQSVIDSWNQPELSESFQILREIANLFTVSPNLINSLVSEGHLANLKVYTVRQYVLKRADFSPSYLERFFGRK